MDQEPTAEEVVQSLWFAVDSTDYIYWESDNTLRIELYGEAESVCVLDDIAHVLTRTENGIQSIEHCKSVVHDVHAFRIELG